VSEKLNSLIFLFYSYWAHRILIPYQADWRDILF